MTRVRSETKLAQYFQAELASVREEAVVFGRQHPAEAAQLGLGAGRSPDPQVELLLQSLAFISARLRHHVEVDKARLPCALADSLYPHLAAPLPSMLVAQATKVSKKGTLARHQAMFTQTLTDTGQTVDCRFRVGCATTLLPLEVAHVRLCAGAKRGQAALCVTLRRTAPAAPLGDETLRFYIDTNGAPDAYKLYDLLSLNLRGVAGEHGAPLPAASLRWFGFADDEALLQANQNTPPAYRLLQEYFAFPQKYLFFDVGPLPLAGMGGTFELQLLLDKQQDTDDTIAPGSLRLNCMPLANLFKSPIEPISLDHTEFEYRLAADLRQHSFTEIYALERMYSVRADGNMRTIEPYFGFDEIDGVRRPDYFYLARRERSEASNVAGSETYVSFLDRNFELALPADEVIGGSALCTNRRLPEQLVIGTCLQLEGAGPPVTFSTVSAPSPHEMPAQIGQRPWFLVSQLALNRLSLAEGAHALAALKAILRLHVVQHRSIGLRQIEGIKSLRTRTGMRNLAGRERRGFVRALHVELELDGHAFQDASEVLFWQVLRHFFALYATVNTVVTSSFSTNSKKGDDSDWSPLDGSQCVL